MKRFSVLVMSLAALAITRRADAAPAAGIRLVGEPSKGAVVRIEGYARLRDSEIGR